MSAGLSGVRSPVPFESVRLRPAAGQPVNALAATALPANRLIENLVLTIFWLLLLEGALRKWVAPQFAQYLFFVRDPFVLLLYWHAVRAQAFRGAGLFLQLGMAFAVVAVFLAFVQSISFNDSRLFAVSIYGWRQYFLYLPLPFAMATMLNRESLERFARHAFVAALLTAALVLVQTGAAPSSVVNRGTAEDASLQFQSFAYTAGRIRPSGTFTSNVGVKELIASASALLLAFWLTPADSRRLRMSWLVAATAGVGMCLALSGSRAAFVHVGLVILSALLVGLIARSGAIRARALTIPIALVVSGAVLYPIVFPEALALMISRVTEAAGSGSAAASIVGRAVGETFDFVNFMGQTPFVGYGLGLGGNGRTYLGTTDPVLLSRIAAESDWSRHIVDLGTLFGVLFILYRIAFTIWLFVQTLQATRQSANPLPLLLFGYVGIGLFYGQLTGHGTVGGFLWLFLGLCMASCRIARSEAQ